jgi:hypothetical protein
MTKMFVDEYFALVADDTPIESNAFHSPPPLQQSSNRTAVKNRTAVTLESSKESIQTILLTRCPNKVEARKLLRALLEEMGEEEEA